MNVENYGDKQMKIITTAETLFAENGYDGTSVRDIAERAQVNVAMISYYFGSKEKLMQAIFEQRTEKLSTRVESLLSDNALSPFHKIEALIDDYLERMVEKHRFYKLMLCEQIMEKSETINRLLKQLKTRNLQVIEKLILDGQQKKVFRKGIDVALLMSTLMGTSMLALTSADFYRQYYRMEDLPADEYLREIQKKLSKHIKEVFKAIIVI